MIPEVVSALGAIREHRGKQALYAAIRPDILNSLVETAKIQNTGSSNRIENISTSDKRLRELMIDKVEPRNQEGIHDPLLVSLLFAFDFVSIHPFNEPTHHRTHFAKTASRRSHRKSGRCKSDRLSKGEFVS